MFVCVHRTIGVTDVAREETVMRLKGHPEVFTHIILQGSLVISCNPKGQVWFWNKNTGEAEAAIQAHRHPITRVRYHTGRVYTAST